MVQLNAFENQRGKNVFLHRCFLNTFGLGEFAAQIIKSERKEFIKLIKY